MKFTLLMLIFASITAFATENLAPAQDGEAKIQQQTDAEIAPAIPAPVPVRKAITVQQDDGDTATASPRIRASVEGSFVRTSSLIGDAAKIGEAITEAIDKEDETSQSKR